MSFLSRIMVLKSKAHFNTDARGLPARPDGQLRFQGTRKASGSQARNRITIMIGCFVMVYAIIGGRLVQYGIEKPLTVSSVRPPMPSPRAPTSSTAMASCWPPMSAPCRCLPSRTRSSILTKRSS